MRRKGQQDDTPKAASGAPRPRSRGAVRKGGLGVLSFEAPGPAMMQPSDASLAGKQLTDTLRDRQESRVKYKQSKVTLPDIHSRPKDHHQDEQQRRQQYGTATATASSSDSDLIRKGLAKIKKLDAVLHNREQKERKVKRQQGKHRGSSGERRAPSSSASMEDGSNASLFITQSNTDAAEGERQPMLSNNSRLEELLTSEDSEISQSPYSMSESEHAALAKINKRLQALQQQH